MATSLSPNNLSSPQVFEFSQSDRTIGLSIRKRTGGPERSLVLQFLETLSEFVEIGEQRIAIFHEPRVEHSFPDLVLSVFKPSCFEEWNEYRRHLSVQDLKVLHFFHRTGPIELVSAARQLGLNERVLHRHIQSLGCANLIHATSSNIWEVVELSQAFAISRLIAIEAKVSDGKTALEQAARNLWFASESYTLMPRAYLSDHTLTRYESTGVGAIACDLDGIEELISSNVLEVPSTYASWLFNEWIGRALLANRESEHSYAFS